MKRTTHASLAGHRGLENHNQRSVLIERLENRQLLSVALKTIPVSPIVPNPPIVINPISPSAPVGVGITFYAVPGTAYSGEVGLLRGITIALPQTGDLQYQASIDWGDGTAPTAGTFSSSPSASALPQTLVDGSHTYTATGKYNVTVTVTDGPLPGSGSTAPVTLVATINSTADVASPIVTPVPPITGSGVTITPVAEQLFTGTVGVMKGYFLPPVTTGLRLTRLVASISWGDSTALSAGSVVYVGAGAWDINGSHTYAKSGTFDIVVKVYQQTGPIALPMAAIAPLPSPSATLLVTIDSTANVSPSTSVGVTLNEVVGKSFTASLGTFDYTASTASSTRKLLANINWGDGSVTAGTIVAVAGKPGVYSVVGTHTYAKTGEYTAKVTVVASPIAYPLSSAVVPIEPIVQLIAQWDSTINVAAATTTAAKA